MNGASLIAVVGDDDYVVRKRSKEIFDKLSEDFPDDLSREIIDGKADNVESVENKFLETKSALETLSLLVVVS